MNVSRRGFLVAVPALALGMRTGPRAPGGSDSETGDVASLSRPAIEGPFEAQKNAPVVSFHLDQPYLDLTGLEKPYIPPAGMRAGAPLAELSDEVLSRFYGFI